MAPPFGGVFYASACDYFSSERETGNRKSLFRTLVTQKFLLLTLKVFEEVYFHR